MKKVSIIFTGPRSVELRETDISPPGPSQVVVKTLFSAISPGSERLAYRGLAPEELPVDDILPSMAGAFVFPFQYGYSSVGVVIDVGADLSPEWQGRTVFCFQPHETFFLAEAADLLPLPADISPEDALFLPAMETGLNLVMDGHPLIGETVVAFGQGIIGLLTAALVAMHPVSGLLTLDRHALRRQWSVKLGAAASFDPDQKDAIAGWMASQGAHGADLIYEISGDPQSLDQAVSLAGFDGRIVIGSWYGKTPVSVHLGGRFHRDRIQLISSQVSTINPGLTGRWDKARRFQLVWEMIRRIQPARCITHRFLFSDAAEAYAFLDRHPEAYVQIMLTY